MSLQPEPLSAIPAETARTVRAAFRKSNVIIRLRDEFGALYADIDKLQGLCCLNWPHSRRAAGVA